VAAWWAGGAVDDEASVRTLLHTYKQGINFVDTAELYGAGHSEKVIGESLISGRYPEWHLRAGVDLDLKRLGVERLDLLQLHGWFADGMDNLDWLATINALRV
jgi:aryl-alcohol dehydrogenase-like predicted oxidoreductase